MIFFILYEWTIFYPWSGQRLKKQSEFVGMRMENKIAVNREQRNWKNKNVYHDNSDKANSQFIAK